jgi:hypothetical protein
MTSLQVNNSTTRSGTVWAIAVPAQQGLAATMTAMQLRGIVFIA